MVQLRGGQKRKSNAPDYLSSVAEVERTNLSPVRFIEAQRRLSDGLQSRGEWPTNLNERLRIVLNNVADSAAHQIRTDAHQYTAAQCPVLE